MKAAAPGEVRGEGGAPALFFAHTIEGMFIKGLGDSLTPGLHEQLKAVGIDTTRPLKAAYPMAVWMEGVRILAQGLYPGVPRDEAYRTLGLRFMAGYFDTLLGKALGAVLKMLGPRRVLQRFEQQFRSGNNFTRAEVTPRGDRDFELWFNHTFGDGPGFMVGLLERGMEEAGAKEVRVTPLGMEGQGCRYRLEWQ